MRNDERDASLEKIGFRFLSLPPRSARQSSTGAATLIAGTNRASLSAGPTHTATVITSSENDERSESVVDRDVRVLSKCIMPKRGKSRVATFYTPQLTAHLSTTGAQVYDRYDDFTHGVLMHNQHIPGVPLDCVRLIFALSHSQ